MRRWDILSIVFGLIASLALPAAAVVLQWDPSPSADVTGYELHYGLDAGTYMTFVDVGSALSASIGDLTPGQTYFFAALAYTADGRESAYSNEVSHLVSEPQPSDTIPPTVSITSPANGATVPRGSLVEIQVSASDNVAVVRVRCTVNGTALPDETTAPYSCPWQVPQANKRTYTLQATAIDAVGNIGTSAPVQVSSQ